MKITNTALKIFIGLKIFWHGFFFRQNNFLFFSLVILLVFLNQVQGAGLRKTSFDNREICESNKGVWHEFGNGCADDCYSKFDEFAVCSQARTFGCDCGKGKCWNNEKCVAVLEYKKVFDEMRQQEIDLMSEAKKKRVAKAKKYQQDLIKRMIENRSNLTVAKYSENGDTVIAHNNFSNNNYGEVYNKKYPEISQGRNYITNFDERYYYSGPIDKNRMKSIQYYPKQPEVNTSNESQINNNTQNPDVQSNINPAQNKIANNNQQILVNPNQNQQIIIQQPGIQDQVVKNNNPPIVEAILDNDLDQEKKDPQPETKNVNQVNDYSKPVETFEVPKNLNTIDSKTKNSKSSELQLPIVELPR
ncbi:hypothetical protein LBMAG18_01580 [Alphaproteobacteria bacterium]|nr:hypothetical protein LBMAG18_01580 [Alphaproteobacteria bacterium]